MHLPCWVQQKMFLNVLTSGNAAKEALSHMMGCCNFTCENHKVDGQKIVISTIFNVFFNNKGKRSTASVRKDNVTSFKKRKRETIFLWYSLIIILYQLSFTLRYFPLRSVLICPSFHHPQLTYFAIPLKKGGGNFWKVYQKGHPLFFQSFLLFITDYYSVQFPYLLTLQFWDHCNAF